MSIYICVYIFVCTFVPNQVNISMYHCDIVNLDAVQKKVIGLWISWKIFWHMDAIENISPLRFLKAQFFLQIILLLKVIISEKDRNNLLLI